MCQDCITLRAELKRPDLTSAEINRINTLIRTCELYTAKPVDQRPPMITSYTGPLPEYDNMHAYTGD
jgi:hypothetical protein